jgi:hypothetical protein
MNQYQQPYGAPVDPNAYLAAFDARIRALEMRLPNTSLVAPSFMKRAFAVWGHMFVSSFIIGLIGSVVGFLLSLVVAGGMLSLFNQAGGGF